MASLSPLRSLTIADRRLAALLLDDGPMLRSELARRIGVSRPAITQMLASLDRYGLVEEGEATRGTRGQPARPVGIRGNAGYSAGVSFSHSYLDVAIIDITGREVAFHRARLTEPTPDAVAEVARLALAAARAQATIGTADLIGLGFALPGDFRVDTLELQAHRHFPAFDQLDAHAFFQSRFAEPVFIENDGRTSAMGERLAGLGRGCRDFLLIHIGHGVGGGLFLNNRLYRGAHFNAGPLGTFFPLDAPRPSGQDLLETLRRRDIAAGDFDALDAIADDHPGEVEAWCVRAGGQLAPVLRHVADLIDPAFMIVGGRLPARLLAKVARATGFPSENAPVRFAGQAPIVRPSLLAARAGAIGAASIPVLDLFYP